MKMKRNIAIATLGVALGTVLVLTQVAWSGLRDQPLKLEGSWVATVPGTPLSWMYTFAPSDPSGREAAFNGTTQVSDPTFGGAFPNAEYVTPFIGEATVNARNQADYSVLWYGMKKGATLPEKVYIVLDSGTIEKTGSGRTQVMHNFAVFLPSQDTDGDGLPDTGGPGACIPLTSIDTRLPLLPPCQP